MVNAARTKPDNHQKEPFNRRITFASHNCGEQSYKNNKNVKIS